MTLFGIEVIGLDWTNLQKLLFTLALFVIVGLLRWALRSLSRYLARNGRNERTVFWIRQGTRLVCTALLLLGLMSIWFDNPQRLTTAIGLVTAGLAFALQSVVTSVAGIL